MRCTLCWSVTYPRAAWCSLVQLGGSVAFCYVRYMQRQVSPDPNLSWTEAGNGGIWVTALSLGQSSRQSDHKARAPDDIELTLELMQILVIMILLTCVFLSWITGYALGGFSLDSWHFSRVLARYEEVRPEWKSKLWCGPRLLDSTKEHQTDLLVI